MLRLILGAVAGIWFYNLANKTATDVIGKFNYSFNRIRVGDVTDINTQLILDYVIKNDNPFGLKVQGFDGVLSQEGKKIVEIKSKEVQQIKANQQSNLAIKMLLKDGIVRDYFKQFKLDKLFSPFYIKGKMMINGVSIPINQKIGLLEWLRT